MACARLADPQHSIVAVTARAKASRCTSTSQPAIPGHIRSISVLLKPGISPTHCDIGSQNRENLSQTLAGSIDYSEADRAGGCSLMSCKLGRRGCPSKWPCRCELGPGASKRRGSSACPISRVPSDAFRSSTVSRKKSARSNPLGWRVPSFPACAAPPQPPPPPVP
jgi:hypothetical protein